jgi:TonB family protein
LAVLALRGAGANAGNDKNQAPSPVGDKGAAATADRDKDPAVSRELLEAKLRLLARTDAEIAKILAELGASPAPETRDALLKLREKANSIAARITQRLNDTVRDDELSLSEADDDPYPGPDEFVPFDEAPQLLAMQPPHYPNEARHAGVEGLVLVRVLVGVDGRVKKTMLIQGVHGLDETALASAWSATFEPAKRDHKPVAIWMVIPIEFSLANKD